MGMHSDDEKELGPTPSIASVSLGAERAFVMKSKFDLNAKPKRIVLASGSLLLMKGDTQKNYKHGVPKQSARLEPRVNLTFRAIMQYGISATSNIAAWGCRLSSPSLAGEVMS